MDETLARQFVAETNKMYDSLTLYETDRNLGRQESNGSLMRCAATGCSLLGNAVYVQALVDDMMTVNEWAAENRAGMQAFTAVDHFDFFLGAEGRLLEAAGTDSSLITAILDQCREARQAARRSEFNSFGFRDALGELRHEVCGMLAELRDAAHGQRPPGGLPPLAPVRPYQRLRACFNGVCGCVLVGLDASALAGTLGLTAAGSAVSIAVGAAIVDHALGDLRTAKAPWTLPPLRTVRRNPPPALA